MGIRELVIDLAKKDGMAAGVAKGREEGKTEVVENLLKTGRFTVTEIANFASVDEDFVLKVKKSIS